MKLSNILSINGGVFIALGIGFTVYAPNLLAYFGVSDLPGDNYILYWNIVSFARLFGAVLLTCGLMLWSIRKIIGASDSDQAHKREILFSLVLGNLVIVITAVTQQSSVWGSPAGWLITGVFIVFLIFYTIFLVRRDSVS